MLGAPLAPITPARPQPSSAHHAPLHPESREASELLESLDDAMFTAIAGDADSADAARELWLAGVRLLPAELIAESREQYLRFARDMSRRGEGAEIRDAARAVVALELILFLTAE